MTRARLLLLVAGLAGLCAWLFAAFHGEAERTAIRQLTAEQRIHARQAAHGIEDTFATWTGVLESIAKMDPVIRLDEDGKRILAAFYEAHRAQVRTVTRVDARGRIVHTVPHGLSAGSDLSGQPHVQAILRDHTPVVSDVFRAVQGFDGIALHVPVFDGAAFAGTVAIVIDFQSLAKRYLEVIRIGRTGHAWVVSRDGTTLYSPVPGLTGRSMLDAGQGSPELRAMAREMMAGHEGTARVALDGLGERRQPGARRYAVYAPVRILNTWWSIAVASSEDEVLASLASFRNRLAAVLALVLLGAVLFSEALRRSLHQVTAAKQGLEAANARLVELDRLKSLFIASMSHELRTPLNSIIGFTGILLQGLAGELNLEQRKQLGMVKSSAEHLLALITDVIDLSKIEAGKIDLASEAFDLAALVREVLGSFQPIADRKQLALSAEVPEGLTLVSDRRRIRQVLVNLVGNAVKFTERGGVSVAVRRRDGGVEVRVRDSGVGIRREDMGRLFRSFSQVTTADAPKHEGTGLGLYLSKRLVNLLGGEIGAESEPGQGSTFSFSVPAGPREAS